MGGWTQSNILTDARVPRLLAEGWRRNRARWGWRAQCEHGAAAKPRSCSYNRETNVCLDEAASGAKDRDEKRKRKRCCVSISTRVEQDIVLAIKIPRPGEKMRSRKTYTHYLMETPVNYTCILADLWKLLKNWNVNAAREKKDEKERVRVSAFLFFLDFFLLFFYAQKM